MVPIYTVNLYALFLCAQSIVVSAYNREIYPNFSLILALVKAAFTLEHLAPLYNLIPATVNMRNRTQFCWGKHKNKSIMVKPILLVGLLWLLYKALLKNILWPKIEYINFISFIIAHEWIPSLTIKYYIRIRYAF